MFSLICVWINGWVNNREAGDLRRYHAHYYAIVMRKTNALCSIKQTVLLIFEPPMSWNGKNWSCKITHNMNKSLKLNVKWIKALLGKVLGKFRWVFYGIRIWIDSTGKYIYKTCPGCCDMPIEYDNIGYSYHRKQQRQRQLTLNPYCSFTWKILANKFVLIKMIQKHLGVWLGGKCSGHIKSSGEIS